MSAAEAAENDFLSFHEVWWIYTPRGEEWAGLRIAHFRKAANSGALIVTITGEVNPRRNGPRIWDDIIEREGWRKVQQIPIPTPAEVDKANMP